MEGSLVSGATAETTRLKGRRPDGAPIYTYKRLPGVPPVSVVRLVGPRVPPGQPATEHAHAHDFLVLAYFERGRGSLRVGGCEWAIVAGDAFVIAPGEVVGPGETGDVAASEGWGVFFPPEVLESQTPGAFQSWRAHPLLFPFVGRAAGGAQRLHVPPTQRATWSERFSDLERELSERRDGYNEAVLAQLMLLLVSLSRLAAE